MDSHEADRRLEAAASKSPELAAMLAGKHDPSPFRNTRLLVLVLGLLAGIGVAWAIASRMSSGKDKVHEPALEVDRSEYYGPIKGEATSAPGEATAPFTGFAISIDTDPPGAVVSIGGTVRGEAPVLSNVSCGRGDKVAVRAERAGFRPVRREVACRADTLVKLTLKLER